MYFVLAGDTDLCCGVFCIKCDQTGVQRYKRQRLALARVCSNGVSHSSIPPRESTALDLAQGLETSRRHCTAAQRSQHPTTD